MLTLEYNINTFNNATVIRKRYSTNKYYRIIERYAWIEQLLVFQQLKSFTQ